MAATEVKPSPDGVAGAVTDPSAIAAEELTYAGAAGARINGYLARPASRGEGQMEGSGADPTPGGGCPSMIVIHEAGGLGEHIRDVCNRFANIGYVTLGVDLYTREGGPPPAGDWEAIMARLFSMPDERALADLEGAADYLRGREDVSGRVGCVGFCMGGRYTLLFACASDRLDAAVDCWGGFIDTATLEQRSTQARPTPPLELAEKLSCPLLAAVGAEDHNPSPELGAQLRERTQASGQEVKVDVYDGAGHAFFADYRPTYRPEPAHRLWAQMVPFLERHLRA